MKKLLAVFVTVFFVFILFGFFYSFAQERIVLTTYYPAPYGVYRELRADQMSVGSGYRNVNLADGQLLVNGSVGIGTANPTYNLEVNGSMSTKYIDAGDLVGGAYNLNFGIPGSSWAVIGNYPSEIPPAVGFYTLGLTTDLRIWASGNDVYMPNSRLGVGEKSPDNTQLYVEGLAADSSDGNAVGLIKLKSPTEGVTLKMGVDTTSGATDAGWINVATPGPLYIQKTGGGTFIAKPGVGYLAVGANDDGSSFTPLYVNGTATIEKNLIVNGNVTVTSGAIHGSTNLFVHGAVEGGVGNVPGDTHIIGSLPAGCDSTNTISFLRGLRDEHCQGWNQCEPWSTIPNTAGSLAVCWIEGSNVMGSYNGDDSGPVDGVISCGYLCWK